MQALLRGVRIANDRLRAPPPRRAPARRRRPSRPRSTRCGSSSCSRTARSTPSTRSRTSRAPPTSRSSCSPSTWRSGRRESAASGGTTPPSGGSASASRARTAPSGSRPSRNLARAEARLLPTQRRGRRRIRRRAIASTGFDPSLGPTLFELLVPNDFKTFAPDRRNLVLLLNSGAATLPWELLHDRYDRAGRPMAVASGMVRQLLDARGRVQRGAGARPHRARRRQPPGGRPEVSARCPARPRKPGPWRDAPGSGLRGPVARRGLGAADGRARGAPRAALAGAAPRRPRRLRIRADPGRAEGHGPRARRRHRARSIRGRADALRARGRLHQLLPPRPDGGETRPPTAFPDLAANLATQFIRMGARVVVAAGWAVDDAAAQTFARVVLRGDVRGEPIRRGRRAGSRARVHRRTAPATRGGPTSATATRSSRCRRPRPGGPRRRSWLPPRSPSSPRA